MGTKLNKNTPFNPFNFNPIMTNEEINSFVWNAFLAEVYDKAVGEKTHELNIGDEKAVFMTFGAFDMNEIRTQKTLLYKDLTKENIQQLLESGEVAKQIGLAALAYQAKNNNSTLNNHV